MDRLFPKSKVGQQCTRLLLDWMEGKISREQFDTTLDLIRKQVDGGQMYFEFPADGKLATGKSKA